MDGTQVAGDAAVAVKSILAVSADSHITEPPNLYIDYIDPAFRERAPFVAKDPEKGGEGFYVEGFARPIALGLLAAAGRDPQAIKLTDTSFEDLHRSGWDPAYRVADQDRDGVQAEFLYPTVGMLICNHPDADYKNACMWAYNRWLQEYVAGAPTRLFGLGQMIVRSPAQAIADLTRMKEMGFKGVMMPGEPETEEEGCLSVPGAYEPLERPGAATVQGVDQHGAPVQLSGTGYLARCFIHESQHLDGTLYWDHLSPELQADALEQRDEERPQIVAERREIAIELDKTPPDYPEKPAGGR